MLRIGATPQFIEAALPEVVTKYASAHPGIEVQLVEDGGGLLVRRYSKGSCILPSECGAPAGFRAGRSTRLVYWPSCGEGIGWQVEIRPGHQLGDLARAVPRPATS